MKLKARFARYSTAKTLGWFVIALCCLVVLFCLQRFRGARETQQPALIPIRAFSFDDDLSVDSLQKALAESIGYFQKLPAERSIKAAGREYSPCEVKAGLGGLLGKLQQHGFSPAFHEYLRDNFFFFQSNAAKVLFTGYYEAELNVASTRSEQYRYPVFKRPQDLLEIKLNQFPPLTAFRDLPSKLIGRIEGNSSNVVPFFSRYEIDYQSKLAERGLELAWANDPITLFFLQIQGSGRLLYPDGHSESIHYAGTNGHPYRAIGAKLIEEGVFRRGEVTMQRLREYLENNPSRIPEILSYNPSYVFFEITDRSPVGSIGALLTPFRSIATDSKVFPPGMLSIVQLPLPVFDQTGRIVATKLVSRLTLNQDTGGAITGSSRVDLFTGHGAYSELLAGHLQSAGALFFLLPKTGNFSKECRVAD